MGPERVARPKAISPITPVEPMMTTKMRYGMRKVGPAVLGDTGGEEPDVAHPHRRADAGQDEPPFRPPGVADSAVFFHGKTPLFKKYRRNTRKPAGAMRAMPGNIFLIIAHTWKKGKENLVTFVFSPLQRRWAAAGRKIFPRLRLLRCLQGDTSCGWDLALYLSYLHPPPWYQHILTVEKQHPTPQMRGTKIATAAGRIGSRGRYERYNKASIQQSPPDGGRTAAGGKGGGSAHSRSMALTGQDSLAWEAVFSRVSVTS